MSQGNKDSREIRVFISSTFSDMSEERKYLNTKIFPELRAICQSRGAIFTEVDLQWGITEDQAKDGAAVEICLEEINRCQPYFIGLLGERYGWSPKDNDLKTVPVSNDMLKKDVQGWLENGESVIAMEIMHGVLDSEKQSDLSYFYFRDKAYTQSLLEESKQDETKFIEPTDSEKAQKLMALKQRILANEGGWHVRETFTNEKGKSCEGYTDIEQLGAQIHDDLLAIINKRFPEDKNPSPIEKERRFHAAFADSRLQVYIPDETMITSIFDALKSSNTPLVVSGKMGSGKSALLAKVAEDWKQEHASGLAIEHYAGSGGEADTVGVLRRVMSEIKHEYNIEEDIPSTDDDVYQKFAQWLFYVTAEKPLLLVLDGVNQFGSDDVLRRFVYALPEHSGDHVSIVLSTLEGGALNAVNDRKWSIKTVAPLAEEQRIALATQYLDQYSKNLDKELIKTLVKSDMAENPLFLRVVLDELRLDATHDKLEEMLESYLKSKDLVALFEMVLLRCEKDYRNSHVPHILSLIWASRYGLSDHELLGICNTESECHVAQLYLSQLIFGLGGYLADREGLYGFMHDALRQAVENKYITDIKKQEAHGLIAAYFSKEDISHRQIDELPWQYVKLQSREKLRVFLRNSEVFVVRFSLGGDLWKEELSFYWNYASCLPREMLETYTYQIEKEVSKDNLLIVYALGLFYYYISSNEGAIQLFETAYKISKDLHRGAFKDSDQVSGLLLESGRTLVACYRAADRLEDARELLEEIRFLALSESSSNKYEVRGYQMNDANVADDEGRLDDAIKIYQELIKQEESESVPNKQLLCELYVNLSSPLLKNDLFEKAMYYQRKAIDIHSNELGLRDAKLGTLLYSLGTTYLRSSQLEEAEQFFNQAIPYLKPLGDEHKDYASLRQHLRVVLGHKKSIASDWSEKEVILREILNLTSGCSIENVFNYKAELFVALQNQEKYTEEFLTLIIYLISSNEALNTEVLMNSFMDALLSILISGVRIEDREILSWYFYEIARHYDDVEMALTAFYTDATCNLKEEAGISGGEFLLEVLKEIILNDQSILVASKNMLDKELQRGRDGLLPKGLVEFLKDVSFNN